MTGLKKLDVQLHFSNTPLAVGEMVFDRGKAHFRYHPAFLEMGLAISPFKLKLSEGILSPDTPIFEGLFGVFNDSLPDAWGRLLLDRTLRAKGVPLGNINPLDRLAHVGSLGMGALAYVPNLDTGPVEGKLQDLDAIHEAMDKVLEGRATALVEELLQLGGSPGGARPKVLVGFDPNRERLFLGEPLLPEGYEPWIVKFPSPFDPPDIAELEHAYYKMAMDAGLEMSPSRLIQGASGRKYFATKRFDRVPGGRLHLHSVSGLLHDDFRYSQLDYGHIMHCAFRLERHVGAYAKVFRMAAFNLFAHNRDDHSKNFSFLMDASGRWKMAPAYDLTFSSSSFGMHSTTYAGEGSDPGTRHLMELADSFEIGEARDIIEQVREVVAQWDAYAHASGVSKQTRESMADTLGRTVQK